jgi:hypothetical protein
VLRTLLVSSLALAATGSLAEGAPAASARMAPEVIILHGGPLSKPIIIAHWWENLDLLSAAANAATVSPSHVGAHPSAEMALFWGQGWGRIARDPERSASLLGRFDEAGKAWLYLTGDQAGAYLVYGRPGVEGPDLRASGHAVRSISPLGLAILHRRGVPLPRVPDSVLVLGTIERFHESLFRGDSAAVLDLLHPDAVVLEGGAVETREEYRSGHLAADIEYLRSTRMRRGPIAVTVIGDAAWARSNSTSELRTEGQGRPSVGAELMVLSKGEMGWQVRAIHWSSGRAGG